MKSIEAEVVVAHLTPVERGVIVSAKIAKFLKEQLRGWIVDNEDTATEVMARGVGWLFVVNGPPAFCNWRDTLAKLIGAAQYGVVWVQNDYSCYPPSQTKGTLRERWPDVNERSSWTRPPVLWSTIPAKLLEECDMYVNWNMLTYGTGVRNFQTNRAPGLFYYGAMRPGRETVLRKYLGTKRYSVTISTTQRGAKNFAKLAPRAIIREPFSDLDFIANYRATVYTQDEYSTRTYTSLANRFYECLAAGVAQFVDVNSVNTFAEADVPLHEDWIVDGPGDVAKRLLDWRQIALDQRKFWRAAYYEQLKKQVRAAWTKLGEHGKKIQPTKEKS